MRISWGQLVEPEWFRSLDIDPAMRRQIRYEVASLRLNDQTMPSWTPGSSSAARDDEAIRSGNRRIDLGGRWRHRLAGGLMVGPILLLLLFDPIRGTLLGGGDRGWVDVVLLIVGIFVGQGILAWVSLRWLLRPAMTPYYATILQRHGMETCGRCGYSRTSGNRVSPCVECEWTESSSSAEQPPDQSSR